MVWWCWGYLFASEGAYTMSWLAATHPAWNAHTEEANTSTQFKLSISLASVSGYRATVTRIDYSGPAKSNYTTHTTDLSLPPPPSLSPTNKLTAWNINPFPCVCLCLPFRLHPLADRERNVALQGPRVSF